MNCMFSLETLVHSVLHSASIDSYCYQIQGLKIPPDIHFTFIENFENMAMFKFYETSKVINCP